MSEPVLSIRGLKRTYVTAAGSLPVLKGVDLDVRPGEIVGLDAMLARHTAQFEQARLILFQRPWVEGEGTARLHQLFLGSRRLDHCAIDRREGFAERGMILGDAFQHPRCLAQLR